MTASGYRRRQRRKGYPRWGAIRSISLGQLRASDLAVGSIRQYQVLSPAEVDARYPRIDYRGRAG